MVSRIFVANLPTTINDDNIFKLFSEYGDVVSARRVINLNHEPSGCGFVTMKNPSQAQRAIKHLHNHYLQDHLLIVLSYDQIHQV